MEIYSVLMAPDTMNWDDIPDSAAEMTVSSSLSQYKAKYCVRDRDAMALTFSGSPAHSPTEFCVSWKTIRLNCCSWRTETMSN